ncbi:DNA invertase Pin-like site-specific DNA recombinase [Bradyrhizobium sp. USDA 336]
MTARKLQKPRTNLFANSLESAASRRPAARKVRCAVYTRKSSEEGLDMDFNSLDAQRESCEAYIVSQRAEGWTAVADRYDDGGFSGGTLERPALKRLLAAVEAGKIDVIVVYKIDRCPAQCSTFSIWSIFSNAMA